MKRLLTVVVPVLLLLTFSVIIFFNATGRAQVEPASTQTQNGGTASVTPNASGSVAAQTGESVEAQRRLQCQNCHGPGKTLPYLGGSLFHAEEHHAYDSGCLYFFTTEGTKTEYISANHEVCFQVEEVADVRNWSSVMALGPAERLDKPEEMERAMQLLAERNPTLEPAVNETKIGSWRRFNNIAIYRVRPHSLHGRKTA